jgi:hypothetical protein
MPIHNTHAAQYIPPTMMMPITGTWTEIAGQVAGTIVKHKGAGAETSVVHIPLDVQSDSGIDGAGLPSKGSLLKSVEIDYEVLVAACTSVTAAVNKIKRGADGAVAVVTAQTVTQDLTAATDAANVDQHKLTVTLATPAYIENDEYYICAVTFVAAATTQIDVLAAVANITHRE